MLSASYVASPLLRTDHQILAIRRGGGKFGADRLHVSAFADQIIGDRPPQRRIGDVMGRIGGPWHVAARNLVLALRAGLDVGQLMRDGVVDGLIIAELEVQERMVLDGAPVAAEQACASR